MPNIDFNLKTHDNAFENDDVFDSSFSCKSVSGRSAAEADQTSHEH